MSRPEADVLAEQLDELLAEPVIDADDALEVAMVAGLLARLDPGSSALEGAQAWLEADGAELLEEAFDLADFEVFSEALDGLTPDDEEEAVEEAVLDIDEVVAAAIWSGHKAAVRSLARETAGTVRAMPEVFASLADVGAELARSPAVAGELDLYDFWLAVADAAAWGDN